MNALTRSKSGHLNSYRVLLSCMALLLMICLVSVSVQAAITAKVDRDTINEGETFTLSLSVSDSDGGQPDVTSLQKDFEVLGTEQRSEVQIINGSVEAHRSWSITLSPRHAGKLVIPPVTLGNDSSAALAVTVLPATASSDSGEDQGDVFIEVNAKPDDVYVQAQLLYTVRLYYAAPLRQGNLTEPTLDNAIVQKLGDDSKFETQRNGKPYQVIERRYAIFPQRSGALKIPAVVFDGEVSDQSRRSGNPFFDNFNASTRHVRLRSRELDMQVAAQPTTYQGANWLPAQEITLEEKWSPENPQFRVGEPITRTVIVRAKGLSASQLPDLPQSDQAGLKVYPDQAQTYKSTSGDGLISEREQKTAMIPTQAGDLTLPAMHLDWWDTEAKRQRSAELPARTIHVLPGAGTATNPLSSKPSVVQQDNKENSADVPANKSVVASEMKHNAHSINIWTAVAVFFALAWLSTLLLWWRISRSRRVHAHTASSDDLTTQAAVKRIKQCCQQNDKQALKSALLDWARLRWPNEPPISLGALAKRVEDEQLSTQILHLDQFLYEANAPDWRPDQLLLTFADYLKHSDHLSVHKKSVALEPLHLNQSRVVGG